MKKIFILTLSLAAAMVVAISCCCAEAKPQSVTITKDMQKDATYAVYTSLKEAKESGAPTTITFEKGTYHFYPEHAYETYCYMSNHGDFLSRIGFCLNDLENITIDGGGSDFIFHGVMIPFLVENAKNVVVKNLSIDFAEPFHSEGVIVANDPKNRTFDMTIDAQYPYEIRNGQLMFIRSFYEHNIGQCIYFDPETKHVAHNTGAYGVPGSVGKVKTQYLPNKFVYEYEKDKADLDVRKVGKEETTVVEQLKPGLLRIHNVKKELPKVGLILTMKGSQGYNRIAPAFKLCNTTNFLSENVTIYHAGGMGYICENSENLEIYKGVITPSQGRIISATADATHFVGCRGYVTLRDCTFHNQLDDASNIHGAYQRVVDIIDNHTLGMRIGHHQQLGFEVAKPGDVVGVVRLADSFHAYEKLTVESVDPVNGRYHVVKFKEALPSKIAIGDLIENITAYPELLIEGCDISRNRARGLLISVPTNTVIRNNYFASQMEAILLPVESGSWYESGNATNVLIEGNTFQDCTNGMERGVIRFATDDESDDHAFKNITIRNNTFNHYENWILQLTNIDGLLFEGNTINFSKNYPQVRPADAVVTINNCVNVELKNNKYNGKAKTMVKTLDGTKPVPFK
ncbi:MAG: right-handed parallel beta-helix repeat-containing protein [Rikenellaceae bacterium]